MQVSAINVLVAACASASSSSSSPPETPRSVRGETVVAQDRRIKRTSSSSQPRGVNASRDRMKQEMMHLRDTVEELQRQLVEIKRDHVKRSPRPHVPLTPSAAQLVAAWESLARGQCEQRYRAEVENVKLRKLLDEQVKIAQTLERILTKRRNGEWLVGQPGAKRARSSSTGPLDHPNVVIEMDAMLPSLYAQADAVLAKECFTRRTTGFRSVDVRHAEETGAFIEATEKRFLPFTYQDTGDAIWEYFVLYPDHSSQDAATQDELKRHVIVRDVELSMQLPRFTGPVRTKFTARRYIDKHRDIVVWIALTDPCAIAETPLDGVHIRNTGWFCTQNAQLDAASPQMAECISAQLAVPEFVDATSDRKRRMCTLTNFLVSAINFHLDASKQTIDNRLLERSLARAAAKAFQAEHVA